MSDISELFPDIHIQNLSKGRISDGIAKRLLCIRGDPADVDAFATEFRAHETVNKFHRLSDSRDNTQYFSSEIAFDSPNPSILSLIHEHDCYQGNAVAVNCGQEMWKIYTDSSEEIHALIDDIASLGNDVALQRSTDLDSTSQSHPIELSTLLTQLTARQQAAFESALELGYYTSENDVTMEDIAAELDVHQTTAWEHVKKAENTVLSQIGQQLFTTTVGVSQSKASP